MLKARFLTAFASRARHGKTTNTYFTNFSYRGLPRLIWLVESIAGDFLFEF